jgi:hypothetical protein
MVVRLLMFNMYLLYGGVLCHIVSWIHAGMNYGFVVGPWRYFVVTYCHSGY